METGEFGNLIIKGTAKNIGSSSLSYAEAEWSSTIKGEHLPDKSPDNINDLGPGETWNFRVVYLGMDAEDADSYKVVIGSGF